MGFLRKIIIALSGKRFAHAMEAESRQWMMRCKEGHEISVWEAGGIRYKAYGKKWTYTWCPGCGRFRWIKIYRRAGETIPQGPAGPSNKPLQSGGLSGPS